MENTTEKILLNLRCRRHLRHLRSIIPTKKKALERTIKFILTLFVADGYRLNSRLN